jgi:hypothetical protein
MLVIAIAKLDWILAIEPVPRKFICHRDAGILSKKICTYNLSTIRTTLPYNSCADIHGMTNYPEYDTVVCVILYTQCPCPVEPISGDSCPLCAL